MEGEAHGAPLKICRRCSVASRTEADDCPACGKPYRRQLNWKIWLTVAIVVAAFFVGFGGRKLLQGDEGDSAAIGITIEQGEGIALGASRADTLASLDGQEPALEEEGDPQPREGSDESIGAQTCIYYPIVDEPDTVWEFCFQDDVLVSSSSVGG